MFKTIADKMLLIGMVAVLAVNGMADTVQPAYAELNDIPGTTQIMTNTVEYVQSAVGDISLEAVTNVVDDIIDERFGTAQFVPMDENGSVKTNLSFETNITFKSKVDFTQSSKVSFGNGATFQSGNIVLTNVFDLLISGTPVNLNNCMGGFGKYVYWNVREPENFSIGPDAVPLPSYVGTIATNVVNGANYLPASLDDGGERYEIWDSINFFGLEWTFIGTVEHYQDVYFRDPASLHMQDPSYVIFGSEDTTTNLPTLIDNRISSALTDLPNLTNTYVEIAKDSSANTQSAIAIGENASAQSPRSISIGHSSTAESVTGQDNFDTIAIGSSSVARLTSAIAIGNGAIASNSCAVAIGKGSKSRSNAAVALGCDANASGGVAISIGNRTQATNTNGIAIGDCAEVGGRLGVALGGKSTAPAIAKGARTVQIGIGTNAVADSFQFNQANLFIARANDQNQTPETVARLGNGFPKANTSRLGAVTVDGTTIGADANGQISVLSTPAKKYALFIIPYEPGTGWTSIEIKGSKENFSSGGYGDFCYLYNTGITVSGWDTQYDNGMSFLTCQTLGQDMRKWTKVVTSTDNITGGYIITNSVSEIAILVGEPLLVAHDYETISENDESINWSYTRFSATGRELNSSGYVIWHPVMPVRWYKSLPSWANQ